MTIESKTEQPGAFRQVVTVRGKHTLHADVDAASGSNDSAPAPHDLYDSALATCKALTATWYAKRHGLALERVEVAVDRDDSRERQGTYVLRVKVAYFGALSDADKQKLHDAVARCPIHKLMTAVKTEIETAPL
jgi:putative redox protein